MRAFYLIATKSSCRLLSERIMTRSTITRITKFTCKTAKATPQQSRCLLDEWLCLVYTKLIVSILTKTVMQTKGRKAEIRSSLVNQQLQIRSSAVDIFTFNHTWHQTHKQVICLFNLPCFLPVVGSVFIEEDGHGNSDTYSGYSCNCSARHATCSYRLLGDTFTMLSNHWIS